MVGTTPMAILRTIRLHLDVFTTTDEFKLHHHVFKTNLSKKKKKPSQSTLIFPSRRDKPLQSNPTSYKVGDLSLKSTILMYDPIPINTNSWVQLTLKNQLARKGCLIAYIHMVKLALNPCGIQGS